jgi:ABC-type multidrug transport system fused ATPase/permease subunit
MGLFFYAMYAAFSYGPILILEALVKHLSGIEPLSDGVVWTLVVLILLLPCIGSLFAAHSNIIFSRIGVQFRNALVNMIYRKSLRLSAQSRQEQSTGMIVTMFSNDTQQLQRFMQFFNISVIAPLQIAVTLYLIYEQVQEATFVGLGYIIILVPINGIIFAKVNKIRAKKLKKTDVRVKLMNEILAGIRIIKYYAWERAFETRVHAVRAEEMALLKTIAYIFAFAFTLLLQASPIVLPILIFYTYIRTGNQLDAATAFTTISLFNLLNLPMSFLPVGLAQYSQSLVSTKRMSNFFAAEELDDYVKGGPAEGDADGTVISMKDASICWLTEIKESKDIKLKAGKDGKLAESRKSGKNQNQNEAKGSKGEYELASIEEGKGSEEIDEEAEKARIAKVNRSLNTLKNINIDIKAGELVAVIGAVGSGKSSFLSALLGEMHLQNGEVTACGSIAYCDQKPWVLNATVEDNILFGEELDMQKFDNSVHAACLEDDITVLPGGIKTEIGEKGINLSGGQKARVALARAVYKDADVYLLDDPLSAVDAHVGQHMFQDCIRGVLGGKTRVLVTHHVHFLNDVDKIIVLEDGCVKAQGSMTELMQQGLDLTSYCPDDYDTDDEIDETNASAEDDTVACTEGGSDTSAVQDRAAAAKAEAEAEADEKEGEEVSVRPALGTPVGVEDNNTPTGISGKDADGAAVSNKSVTFNEKADLSGISNTNVSNKQHIQKETSVKFYSGKSVEAEKAAEKRKIDKRKSVIMSKEERNRGSVPLSAYHWYIKSGGYFLFSLVVFGLIFQQLFQLLASFYLAFWGEVSITHMINGDPLTNRENMNYLEFYAMLAMLSIAATLIRALMLAEHRLGTSISCHDTLTQRVLNAPIAFFDVTPLGRVLNRFSSDMVVVDEDLSATISQVAQTVFQVLGAIGAVSGSTKGTFLILLFPMMWFYNRISSLFRLANTSVARLESISRSPIYADFSQALTGANSIRAYKEEKRFVQALETRVDSNTVAQLTIQLLAQWLSIRLDVLGGLVSFFVATLAVAGGDFIPPEYLAVGLAYSFQMTLFLKFAVRMFSSGEAQMNAIERVMFYIQNINQENTDEDGDVDNDLLTEEEIPEGWPSKGQITAEGVQMSYRDGPLVLKGLDFTVDSAEKVGVVGRTGSGKSSMMVALFRIEDLSEGRILIDNIDISRVNVHSLRSRLGIIPQDPVMFSASVRFNLDPFEDFTDAHLWEILEAVNMKDHINTLPDKLDEEVAEGGENFSAGQRQLICIARALLRKPKILVLDEATASIDNETDEKIQKMVRLSFKECTVLTIAHRLHTIVDSDRIMVLQDGKLGEMDTTENLLRIPDGIFKGLWDRHNASHGGATEVRDLANSRKNI